MMDNGILESLYISYRSGPGVAPGAQTSRRLGSRKDLCRLFQNYNDSYGNPTYQVSDGPAKAWVKIMIVLLEGRGKPLYTLTLF